MSTKSLSAALLALLLANLLLLGWQGLSEAHAQDPEPLAAQSCAAFKLPFVGLAPGESAYTEPVGVRLPPGWQVVRGTVIDDYVVACKSSQ